MIVYAILGMFLMLAGGVWYVDSNAVARSEGKRNMHAAKVFKESSAFVLQESDDQRARLEGSLSAKAQEAVVWRERAKAAQTRAEVAEQARDEAIAAGQEPEEPGVCRPGCQPAWE